MTVENFALDHRLSRSLLNSSVPYQFPGSTSDSAGGLSTSVNSSSDATRVPTSFMKGAEDYTNITNVVGAAGYSPHADILLALQQKQQQQHFRSYSAVSAAATPIDSASASSMNANQMISSLLYQQQQEQQQLSGVSNDTSTTANHSHDTGTMAANANVNALLVAAMGAPGVPLHAHNGTNNNSNNFHLDGLGGMSSSLLQLSSAGASAGDKLQPYPCPPSSNLHHVQPQDAAFAATFAAATSLELKQTKLPRNEFPLPGINLNRTNNANCSSKDTNHFTRKALLPPKLMSYRKLWIGLNQPCLTPEQKWSAKEDFLKRLSSNRIPIIKDTSLCSRFSANDDTFGVPIPCIAGAGAATTAIMKLNPNEDNGSYMCSGHITNNNSKQQDFGSWQSGNKPSKKRKSQHGLSSRQQQQDESEVCTPLNIIGGGSGSGSNGSPYQTTLYAI